MDYEDHKIHHVREIYCLEDTSSSLRHPVLTKMNLMTQIFLTLIFISQTKIVMNKN